MITRIEIDGFKTFERFSIDLAPFVVVAGANGSGKSNLFDAILLLSSLAEKDLKQAFSEQRGEARELFTQYSDGEYSDRMHFAVELLLGRQAKDSWGIEKELSHIRLRYELTIVRREEAKSGLEKLFIDSEHLTPIKTADDSWLRNFELAPEWKPAKKSYNYKPYIYTVPFNGVKTIFLRQDGVRGGRPSPATEAERTVLSSVNTADFPHAFAVREEFLNWRLLHLNPVEMREPAPMLGPDRIDEDGKYLPSMLRRLLLENPMVLKDISRQMQNLIPNIKEILLEEDKAREQFVLHARSTDGRKFSSRVLSEGTLRMLVLCALRHDDQHRGLLCFEEPENGIHPFRMKKVLFLLKDLSTDFSEALDREYPLRQVFINTHSPLLVKEYFEHFEQLKGVFYYASLVSRVHAERRKQYKLTQMRPVVFGSALQGNLQFPDYSVPEKTITHTEVINYLRSDDVESAIIEQLEKI